MKKFFREHGIWVLFATAVIAVSLSLMSFFSNTSSPLSNLAGIIASPFRSAYTAVTGWITDKQNYYQDVTALEEENAALRRENAILKAQNRLAQTNNEENARLRELLAAAVDLLRHCTVNQFEVWRNGERMTALPVLILILLVLVAYWISLPLLVVGLFFGCKYRFSGPDLDKNRVGEVVNQVSAKVGDAVGQVRDEFKREFDKSRGKKGK